MSHIVIVPGTNRAGSNSLHLARQVQSDYMTLGCSTDLLELDLEADFLAAAAYQHHTSAITSRVERFLKSALFT